MLTRLWPATRLCFRASRFETVLHRCYATTRDDPSKLRNIAVVAHIDSGKTTLTESILLKSSYLSSAGSVDTGSTTTDFLPAERERGITIQSASIPVKWRDWTFNLIDTPGHADFGMEVESASRVVDGAVVLLDSVEGVEAQTKGVWRQLDRYSVFSRLIFLNKLDRAGASFSHSVASLLSNRLHPKPMVLTLPIASFNPDDYSRAEPGIQGLIDLVEWELWKWDKHGDSSRHPLPRTPEAIDKMKILPPSHPIIPHLLPARASFLENLAMFSDELMTTLLDHDLDPSLLYLSLTSSQIMPHLRNATLKNSIVPVICGSAIKHIGTEIAMNYVGELLPSPADDIDPALASKEPLRMLAWKVGWDKRKGWMTYVRVYSGILTQQSTILNATRNRRERVSKIVLLYASEAQEVDSLSFGSVGVIMGLKHTRTGDTLVSTHRSSDSMSLSDIEIIPPPPVMSMSVIPQSHSDLEPVQEALESLSRTDPSVRVEMHEGQMLVHGLGSLHLEIVENRLREEWKAQFELGKRRVSYREGLGGGIPSAKSNMWTTDIAGKPMTVMIDFALRSLDDGTSGDPFWDGNVVLDEQGHRLRPPESYSDHNNPQAHLARGIFNALSNSPHTSLALSNVWVQIKKYHYPKDAAPLSVLAGASAVILRDCIRSAGTGPLLEPFVRLKITINQDSVGKVTKDLTENGGEILNLAAGSSNAADMDDMDAELVPYPNDGVYIPPKELSPSSANSPKYDISSAQFQRSIYAIAPLNRMLDYSNRLRALSGGHGLFETVNAGYQTVTETRKVEILRELGRL